MDFDELDEAQEPLEPDLRELLEKYDAPDPLWDFLRTEGLHSCLLLAKYCESKDEAESKILSQLNIDSTQGRLKWRVCIRNLWGAAARGKDDDIEKLEAERKRQGGILLKLFNSDEQFLLPMTDDLKAANIKEILASYLGELPKDFHFYVRDEGGLDKRLANTAIMPNQVFCYGIDDFERRRQHYSHPFTVIGAGHYGLRMALMMAQEKVHDYVCFERHDAIGGTAWLINANHWSKVQSELGTYHLSYSHLSECPTGLPPWPSRDQLLKHFQDVCDSEGVTPHFKLSTDVTGFVMKKNKSSGEMTYEIQMETKDGQGIRTQDSFMASCVTYFPGNLTVPRRAQYKGEDNYEGKIFYGMFGETDYSEVTGKQVGIVGMGAFAIENCRTCVEHHAKKIYVLCRRKHLAMPRMTSFILNNSLFPFTGAQFVDHMRPMYDLCGEDPYDYHSVTANSSRSIVSIRQSARTGIGDIYFLARFYGKVEVLQSSVLRLTRSDVILDIGKDLLLQSRTLTLSVLIKSLGFEPAWDGDKLMQCTEYTGYWCDYDYRRATVSDLRSLDASNFGGTSLSPGAITQCYAMLHCLWYPADFQAFMDMGICPKHTVELDKGYPAIVLDAKQGSTTGMVVMNSIPWLPIKMAVLNGIKRGKMQGCHSTERIQKMAEDEWYHYCELFKAEGDNRPFPPYPYPIDVLQAQIEEQDQSGALKFGGGG